MKKVKLNSNDWIITADGDELDILCPLQQETTNCGRWCMWFNVSDQPTIGGIRTVYCKGDPVAELLEDKQ